MTSHLGSQLCMFLYNYFLTILLKTWDLIMCPTNTTDRNEQNERTQQAAISNSLSVMGLGCGTSTHIHVYPFVSACVSRTRVTIILSLCHTNTYIWPEWTIVMVFELVYRFCETNVFAWEGCKTMLNISPGKFYLLLFQFFPSLSAQCRSYTCLSIICWFLASN